jgi:two-component system, NarL family, response regulator NreC
MGRGTLTAKEDERGALAEIGAKLAARPYAKRGVPASGQTIRVVLVDDHAMVREGLRVVLRAAPDIAVVGEADDGERGITLAHQLTPDVVVLDLDMPGTDGQTALRRLGRELPGLRVLILTMYAEHERLLPLLEAGARGYLSKEAASQDLVDAIRVVAAGDVYVRPAAARLLAAAVVPQRAVRSAQRRFEDLSRREQTVVSLVAEGYSGVEIAERLGVSTKTIAAYKRRIHDKVDLQHRTDYVRFAIEAGLLGA